MLGEASSPFCIPVSKQCYFGSRVMRIFTETPWRPNCCSVKPRHGLASQWLENVKMYKYAKFDPNIPFGSRVMSIFTN